MKSQEKSVKKVGRVDRDARQMSWILKDNVTSTSIKYCQSMAVRFRLIMTINYTAGCCPSIGDFILLCKATVVQLNIIRYFITLIHVIYLFHS